MKFKCSWIALALLLLAVAVQGQTYNMSNTPVTTCSGTFYDDGGIGGYYNDYASYTQTFTSSNGNRLSFAFNSYSSWGGDVLYAYDGPNNTYPLLGAYTGIYGAFTITSTGTSITFVFTTNGNGANRPGWEANISCTTPALTAYDMSSGTTTACSGVFYDNGGATASYPNNENRVQTFCSGTTDYLQFVFTQGSYNINTGDTLFIYDGATASSPLIAAYTGGSIAEPVTSTGTCLTFWFKSDASGNASGWQAIFSCVSSQPAAPVFIMSSGIRGVCSGTFYDDGGTGGDYNDYAAHTQIFYSNNGNRIKFDFTSFSTWGGDILYIYDGPNNTYPLLGAYSGIYSPFSITSTGTMLTFVFTTNGNGAARPGWTANISCTTAPLTNYVMSSGTTTACSGVFYDNGGSTASYPNNENRVQTFCSGTSDYLQFVFTQAAYNISTGDTLFIYDGPNTSASLLAAYTGGSIAEIVTSTGTCLTFSFKSDASGTASGWHAVFGCVSSQPAASAFIMSSGIRGVCSGTFYDDGGTGGDYNDYAAHTQTFYSNNGNRIQFDFTSFSTWGGDVLYIYDGPNNTYPLLGAYSGIYSPFSITSTGTMLTFVFTTNGNGAARPGWTANISCTTAPLTNYVMGSGTTTACSGVFYDNGGSTANYPNNENRVQTFCSGNGQYLEFVFTQAAFGLSSNDSLFIFDGASVSSQPIAVYTAGSIAETITSTGTCITFLFKSDGSGNSTGWQAIFNCTSAQPSAPVFNMSSGIRYTCNATFYDDGGIAGNYNDYVNRVQTFVSTGGCGLRATFNSFNTYDPLKIYDGPSTASPLIGTYQGTTSPGIIQASGTTLTFEFIPVQNGVTQSGWDVTFSCPSQTAPPVITTNSPVCEGATVQLNASNIPGATYTWTGPNGFTSSSQNPVISNATPAEEGTYTVTAIVGGCSSNQAITNVVVDAQPSAPTASNNGPLCSGSTLDLFTTAVAGATAYSWIGPNGFTSTLQNPSVVSASVLESGTYTVTAIAGSCTVQATTTATITQTPGAPVVSSNSPVCETDTLQLFASSTGASLWSWTGPNGFTSTLQDPSVANVTLADAGTYTVTAFNGSCSSQEVINVTVGTVPPAPNVSSNSPVCEGEQLDLTAAAVTGASYNWSGPGGFSSSSQNPSMLNVPVSASGAYSATITLDGCVSPAATVNVTVNPLPGAPVITLDQVQQIISSSYTSGNQWYLNGNILPGETGQDLFYPNYSTSGTYTVTYTDSSGCSATSAPYILTVSVDELSAAIRLEVKPNPSNGVFMISLGNIKEDARIVFSNVIGQVIFIEEVKGGNGDYVRTFAADQLAKGIYSLTVSSGAAVIVKRIVIR